MDRERWERIRRGADLGVRVVEWGMRIVEAMRDGDIRRVEELLPDELATTRARDEATIKARARFSRNDEGNER